MILILVYLLWFHQPQLNPTDDEWLQTIRSEREERMNQQGLDAYQKLDEKYGKEK